MIDGDNLTLMAHSPKTHNLTPIFVGGTGRSGTTILGDLLNEHSQIRTSNPTEIKFLSNRGGLLDVIFGSPSLKLLDRKKISMLHVRTYRQRKRRDLDARYLRMQEFKERLWQKWWEIDAQPPHGPGLHAGIDKEALAQIISRFEKSLKGNPSRLGTRFMNDFISAQLDSSSYEKYWAETTPMNISYARQLLILYPQARFIVMRRDPRDVIASLLTKDWGPTTPLEGIEWIEKRLRSDSFGESFIPDNQLLVVNLEDLVSNSPKESYQRILNFLKVIDEPAMRAFHQERMSSDLASSGRWKTQIDSPEFSQAFTDMIQRLEHDSVKFGLI